MKKRTGFALLTEEERKVRAAEGGRAAHAKGTARRWTQEEAALAGRKGGEARARNFRGMSAKVSESIINGDWNDKERT